MPAPYLARSAEKPGALSRLFRAAAEKNNQVQRSMTIEERRLAQHRLAEIRPAAPGIMTSPDLLGNVPCEWNEYEACVNNEIIIYVHGGSWIFGSARTARPVAMLLAELSRYRVLSIDYRLSPEYFWPAALEDCFTVYRHLLDSGIQPKSISLMGDSAGGNLVLSLLHLLKQQNLPFPAAVACASPVTDITERSFHHNRKTDLMYVRFQGMEHDIFSLYANGADRSLSTLSPRYGDMTGFPPILIHTGEDEALCNDNISFAKAAYQYGVDVFCKVWKEMFHDFTVVGITLKESRKSLLEITDFFRTHMEKQQMLIHPQE